ncbi:MAG: DUF4469 domain-containing protein [Spirochaetaceae bacterium]|jgi:hypothetical protein|nr:DUF4469 domain-containing protein [Spirochaetaceae bacterium]
MALTDDNMPDEFHRVLVKLYESQLPKMKGQHFAKMINGRTLKNEDIAALIVERRGTKWKLAELKDAFRLYCREICIQLCDGYAVNVGGLFSLRPHVKGVVNSLRKGILEEKHRLGFHFSVLGELNEAAEHIVIEVVGLAGTGAFIDTFTDVKTGLVNQKATSGGQFILAGVKVMVAGAGPGIGLSFVSTDSPPVEVKVTEAFAVNSALRVVGIIPDLPPGKQWTIEVRTQFSNESTMLKEARTIASGFTVSS